MLRRISVGSMMLLALLTERTALHAIIVSCSAPDQNPETTPMHIDLTLASAAQGYETNPDWHKHPTLNIVVHTDGTHIYNLAQNKFVQLYLYTSKTRVWKDVKCSINSTQLAVSRIVLECKLQRCLESSEEADHIHHDRTNNSFSNLRAVPKGVAQANNKQIHAEAAEQGTTLGISEVKNKQTNDLEGYQVGYSVYFVGKGFGAQSKNAKKYFYVNESNPADVAKAYATAFRERVMPNIAGVQEGADQEPSDNQLSTEPLIEILQDSLMEEDGAEEEDIDNAPNINFAQPPIEGQTAGINKALGTLSMASNKTMHDAFASVGRQANTDEQAVVKAKQKLNGPTRPRDRDQRTALVIDVEVLHRGGVVAPVFEMQPHHLMKDLFDIFFDRMGYDQEERAKYQFYYNEERINGFKQAQEIGLQNGASVTARKE